MIKSELQTIKFSSRHTPDEINEKWENFAKNYSYSEDEEYYKDRLSNYKFKKIDWEIENGKQVSSNKIEIIPPYNDWYDSFEDENEIFVIAEFILSVRNDKKDIEIELSSEEGFSWGYYITPTGKIVPLTTKTEKSEKEKSDYIKEMEDILESHLLSKEEVFDIIEKFFSSKD